MKDVTEKIIPLQNLFAGIWEKIRIRETKPSIVISSLPNLNDKLWGLHRQELMVIGGRTSMAKSAFALQLAWDVALQGFPVHYLSLEMTKEALVERLFCQQMRVENDLLRKGRFKDEPTAGEFKQKISNMPLLITDTIGNNIQSLYTLIEPVQPRPFVVIIDYIQAIDKLRGERLDTINEYIRFIR